MVIRHIFLLVFSAIASLSCLAQDKPKKPYELHEQAERAYNSAKYAEALALLDQCLKANPGYMDAYSLRASVRAFSARSSRSRAFITEPLACPGSRRWRARDPLG